MPIRPDAPAVELVVPALRAMLRAAGVPFRFAGGLAVVHHGYPRLTDDVDVLVELTPGNRIDELLGEYGFARAGDERLLHVATGVRIDLLVAGGPMPRPGSPVYPSPRTTEPSPHDADYVGLRPLLELKLHARRHKDLADAVELLKRVEEARYLGIEASFDPALRPALAELRRDALEELAFEGSAGR